MCALHVTNAEDRTIKLPAIASANDAPTLWDLRGEIREKLIAYLRDEYPGALPVVRARVRSENRPTGSGDAPPTS